MLSNRNIIYFANDWGADHKTSSHHIAEELMKTNRVLYIETGGMRKPRRSKRDLKRVFARLFSWARGARKINDNLYIHSLIIFPFHNKLARKVNAALNSLTLRRAMRRYAFSDPILWFVAPHVSYLADDLGKDLTVYYCTDNVAGMPDVDRPAIEKLEDELLKKSDVVFATAEYLCDRLRCKGFNKDIFYSPHAVDFKHFSRAREEDLEIADELKSLKRPVIGYVGLIEKWLDLDLVAHIAKARPGWTIVLIGRIAAPVGGLARFSNIRFLGIRSYQELPRYLKGFDVAILPFKINELTKSVNPIKIKEYLAAGKPVVATALPEVYKMKEFVEIADSPENFVAKIEYLLQNDNDGRIGERMRFVKQDNWHDRVERISDVIERSGHVH